MYGRAMSLLLPAPLGRWPESKRPMGIGIMLPLLDGGAFGGQPRFKDILEMAQTVEACGFDGVWMPDHFIFRHEANNRTRKGSGKRSPPLRRLRPRCRGSLSGCW